MNARNTELPVSTLKLTALSTFVVLVLAVMGLFSAEANAAQTSVSQCAGSTPSPLIQGAVRPWANEELQIDKAPAYRSGCYSGSQYIQVEEILYVWNAARRSWTYDNKHTDGGWTSPGYYFYADPFSFSVNGGYHGYFSLNIEYTWWRKSSNGSWVKVGYRTRRFIHSSDYKCYDPTGGSQSAGSCSIGSNGGRYGVFLWSF